MAKVQKHIRICDECSDDADYRVAVFKCEICKKDLCDDDECLFEYGFSIGEIDDDYYVDLKRLKGFRCCKKCLPKITIRKTKDKAFIEKIDKEIKEYVKCKVTLDKI